MLSSNFDQEFLKLKVEVVVVNDLAMKLHFQNDLLDDHIFSRHGFNVSDFGKSSNNSYK